MGRKEAEMDVLYVFSVRSVCKTLSVCDVPNGTATSVGDHTLCQVLAPPSWTRQQSIRFEKQRPDIQFTVGALRNTKQKNPGH